MADKSVHVGDGSLVPSTRLLRMKAGEQSPDAVDADSALRSAAISCSVHGWGRQAGGKERCVALLVEAELQR